MIHIAFVDIKFAIACLFKHLHTYLYLFYFETGFHSAGQTSLVHPVVLPQLLKGWYYKFLPHLEFSHTNRPVVYLVHCEFTDMIYLPPPCFLLQLC